MELTGEAAGPMGERIRLAREQRGWTQAALAHAIGVSRSAVAQWETGRAGQVTANLARIAAVLGIGLEQLVHGTPAPAPVPAPERTGSGDELAMMRLYRACSPEDRQTLLRLARRLAGAAED